MNRKADVDNGRALARNRRRAATHTLLLAGLMTLAFATFASAAGATISGDYCGTSQNPRYEPPTCVHSVYHIQTYGQVYIQAYTPPLSQYNVCAGVQGYNNPFACTYNNAREADWTLSGGVFGEATIHAGSNNHAGSFQFGYLQASS